MSGWGAPLTDGREPRPVPNPFHWMRMAMRHACGCKVAAHDSCPWCGSGLEKLKVVGVVIGGTMTGAKAVHCEGCDAYGPSGATPDQAWAYWDGQVVPCKP